MLEKHDIEVLRAEYETDIQEIEEKLERTAINLNALHYEVGAGFGFWDDYGKRTKKLIKESQELWIQKSFLENKLENLEQQTLDEYSQNDEEGEIEEPSEEEIEAAIDETETYEDEE